MGRKYETVSYVQRRVWGPDDTYLKVEVQVFETDFKMGDRVRVTVEKMGAEPPVPKAVYKCPKCGWTGKERGLSTDETSGDAWCPRCGAECKRVHKRAK